MGRDLEKFTKKLDLVKIGEQLKQYPEAVCPVKHHFADGQYVRETSMPKGTFAIGKKHRFQVVNILLKGHIKVFMGEDQPIRDIIAPCVFVSGAGVQKMAYFMEDTVWINCHPTASRDLEQIEKEVIIADNEPLIYIDTAEEHF